eukprot:TRINITY_DN70_c0_g1_i18.p1 TRINITY_DN70_c0_g1~~TRINITY_DN70_c0_g1_i18.p1  ORF type:complete len:559 (-),score=117.12 TRINITY_DN70_c0_g1_i18:131-1807(-)
MASTQMSSWRKLFAKVVSATRLATVVVALGAASTTSAMATEDPFEELRQRIEQLEKDNDDLRTAMVPQGPTAVGSVGAVPPAPDDLEPPTEEEQRIQNIVERYLQRHPDVNDAAQNQTIQSIQGNISKILEKMDKKTYPNVQIHGAFQADAGVFSQDTNSKHSYGDIQNGADFRRARLQANGALTERTNYFFQMDFAFFGRPTFTDVWVEQTQIPILGNWRVGQWKQPFSLEVVSSYRYTTFAERSVLFQAFTPFRHLGTGFYNNSQNLDFTWAASTFTTGQDQYGGTLTTLGGIGTSERVTYLPYWDECSNGREYLHLGLGHFFNAPPNRTTIFRTIPELYIGQNAAGAIGTSGQAAPGAFNGTPFFVNTGALGVSTYNVLGTELLFVEGPFSLQAEGMVTFVNQASGVAGTQNIAGGSMATLPGFYAQAGYFLTGEHRPYNRKLGQIDRIMPKREFNPWASDCDSGWGAWEVAGRASYIDLNDKNIRGGQMHDYTAGVNWYLNPYWKIQFNYIYSISDFTYAGTPPSPTTNAPAAIATGFLGNHTSIFDLRCQMDF